MPLTFGYAMNDYILFMHDDAVERAIADDGARWGQYLAALRASGQFDGGSAIGAGILAGKSRSDQPAASNVTGYLRVRAESLEAAKRFLDGNPVYEAGGTVEVRELPKT
jgi:hypothetical protein